MKTIGLMLVVMIILSLTMIDLIMTATACAMGYAMVPQVVKSVKDRDVRLVWQTLIVTTICLFILTVCYWQLGLKINTVASGLVTLLWASLLVMKIIFKRT